MWSVELNLDQGSEDRVRAVWASIEARGVESLGSVRGTTYRPHVSLAAFEKADEQRLAVALPPVVGRYVGMPLTLATLGLFLSPSTVAFLGVTPTARLLDLHRGVHAALDGLVSGSRQLYEPGTFVPHCTLAMGFDDPATVVEAIDADRIPIHAAVHEVHLVDTSTGRSRLRLA
ncbi:hypothetical protein GCM10022242_39650 [Nocardioides panacisoli]|uniref:2'-5' RNA ligase family protein n=1 Tax=Nocardioides panacisoli TaxID=627624 RepID=A0ABP7J645_9ACTN